MKFTAIYDDSSAFFSNDKEYNLAFLKAQERYMNDLLKVRGILFLNQIISSLGIEPIRYGQTYGWSEKFGQDRIKMDVSEFDEKDGLLITFEAYKVDSCRPYQTNVIKVGGTYDGY